MTIEQTYNHFLTLTGEPAAAATLTLAAVRSEERQVRFVFIPPETRVRRQGLRNLIEMTLCGDQILTQKPVLAMPAKS